MRGRVIKWTLILAAVYWACGIETRTGNADAIWPPPWGQFVVLGKVESIKCKKGGPFLETFDYGVRVICEYRDQIEPNSEIVIHGERRMVGSELVQIPVMAKGTYFIFPIDATPSKGTYEYRFPIGFKGWLPIGIPVAAPVAKEEVPDLKIALLKYGELFYKPQSIGHTEAYESFNKLFNNGNFYLWALAASAIAYNATHDDITTFEAHLQQDPAAAANINSEIKGAVGIPEYKFILSPRRAFWLVHLLTEVVPKSVRPPCDEVQRAFIYYWDRWERSAEKDDYVP